VKTHSEDPEARANRLEVEVAKLKDMLDKAKSINDAMWENLVQQTAAQARSQ
jgi:pre-rRNA-processing protein IPI3